ncbi:MAG TPA: beta-propeller fold lactonase family protein [Tepidisphaeraceae bacterium]|nr:beta-propeller fold lactonase family protein [Tepidisphaeraceae bacterium]
MLSTVVYTESNNPAAGQNAVLAFTRNANGTLSELSSSPFLTGGTGIANPTAALGPDDSDQEVELSADHRFLLAVNQGSNSITVFKIRSDGSLSLVPGAPFSSNGVQPVSLGVDGDKTYVTNRGDEIQGQTGTVSGNYTGFLMHSDGSLTPIANSTITLPVGLSPAQSLISRTGRFVFGDNFTPPPLLNVTDANTIETLRVGSNGSLKALGAVGASVTPPLVLGLAQHPTANILYAGLTGANEVGVFTYDSAGTVTFRGPIADQGMAACWLVVSADGKYLYVANSASDDVGVYSLSDPLHPVQIQEFSLAGPRHLPGATANQTVDFQMTLDPTGRLLYVVNHETAPPPGFAGGNQLHVLRVDEDGALSERKTSPLIFPVSQVPATAHPQGIAAISLSHAQQQPAFSPRPIRDGDEDDDDHRLHHHKRRD